MRGDCLRWGFPVRLAAPLLLDWQTRDMRLPYARDNQLTIMITTLKTLLACALLSGTVVLAAEKGQSPKPYPLDTCVVSGEEIGGMGEGYTFVYEGREIQLCCKGCKKDFDKDPKKYIAKVDTAAKKVKPYKASTCPMSGEKLGADAPAIVYKGQEVKFCCNDCKKKFARDPAKYLAKVESALKAK